MDTQLRLGRLADRSGAGETDQALGKVRCLRPGRQLPGGDAVHGAALAVSGGDTVADEKLVKGRVREWPVLEPPVGGTGHGTCAVIGLRHDSSRGSGDVGTRYAAG
jgi:hypothetical protein